MRILLAALLIAALAGAQAQAAAIGGPLLRDGLEIVPSALNGVELDRMPMAKGADSILLVADVRADKDDSHGFPEHSVIPYLSVSYLLTKDDAPTFKKAGLLYPLAAKDGSHYAAPTQIAGPGVYHLTYIVSPPSSHGMMRRTDKAGGVPDWWKPITVNWTFNYPMSVK
jgi:periplasmic iron binding protein